LQKLKVNEHECEVMGGLISSRIPRKKRIDPLRCHIPAGELVKRRRQL
jgi:hypothetical protein